MGCQSAYSIYTIYRIAYRCPSINTQRPRRSNRRNRNAERTGTRAPPVRVNRVPASRNPVMRFKRALTRTFSVNSSGIDIGGSNNLQVTFAPGATDWRVGGTSLYTDSLPNVTEFSNLFDQYKINGIYLQIDLPLGNSNAFAQPLYNPLVYYAADYDDPFDTDLNSLLQYPQMQQHNFWRDGYTPLIVRLSPKPLREIAGSGMFSGYGPMPVAPWIRTGEMSVPHYGLKLCLDWFGLVQTTSMKMKVTLWYDLSFTNPK